jgi:beta-galactosidase
MALYTNKLKDAGYLTLNIDLIQMGLGGNDSWSDVAAPLNIYQIPAKPYQYSFYLYPYQGSTERITNVIKKMSNAKK